MRQKFVNSIISSWILHIAGDQSKRAKMKVLLICALIAAVAADVSHLSNEYLPPNQAASAPVQSYAAPAADFGGASYETAASAPAVSYSGGASYDNGGSYGGSSLGGGSFGAASAPVQTYSAPAAVESYDTGASAPAHTFSSSDGYRYKTHRRRVLRRHRRDVSHLPSNDYLPPVQGAASAPSNDYLPPVAASAPVASYSAPAASYSSVASYSAPAPSYSSGGSFGGSSLGGGSFGGGSSYTGAASAPAVSYDTGASAPAHSFSSSDGYRYKTQRRRVVLRRRH
ncbi:protein transport protein sec31 [Drosophila grimshawi]|uniref:protein transport protein sec31 n=1 Tax=Drosophila grimshawi TaxID=7222 RepID=UPI0013EF18B8|nr:protein transport protein sec31 [Drosophila grimshawi]